MNQPVLKLNRCFEETEPAQKRLCCLWLCETITVTEMAMRLQGEKRNQKQELPPENDGKEQKSR